MNRTHSRHRRTNKYLERKNTTINQRDIDNGENVQLENNESNTVIKESVETEITHINDEIIIKESTNQGQMFYCDICTYNTNFPDYLFDHTIRKPKLFLV